jgi:hypothetical protein
VSTIAERVAAGAAFLDEHEPGWDQHIDLDRLDIDSNCRCILGQLHDDSYQEGRRELGLSGANHGVALGFYPSRTDVPTSERLTAEWVRVIAERRAAS